MSRQVFAADGEYDDLWSVAELQLRRGLTRKLDAGIKLSRISIDDGYQFLALDPKVALVGNRLAFSMPMGTFFGNGIDSGESYQIHPTLLISDPVNGMAELNFALKGLLFFDADADDLWGVNAGVRFMRGWHGIHLHPEIGFLFNPGDEGYFFQWGIGVVYSLDVR